MSLGYKAVLAQYTVKTGLEVYSYKALMGPGRRNDILIVTEEGCSAIKHYGEFNIDHIDRLYTSREGETITLLTATVSGGHEYQAIEIKDTDEAIPNRVITYIYSNGLYVTAQAIDWPLPSNKVKTHV